jgi:hypothetical protein
MGELFSVKIVFWQPAQPVVFVIDSSDRFENTQIQLKPERENSMVFLCFCQGIKKERGIAQEVVSV